MHHPNGAAQPYLLTHIEWHFRAPNGKWHFAKWISIQIASLKFINVCFSDLVIKKRTSHHDEKKNYFTGSAGSNTNTNTTASNEDEYEYYSSEVGTTAGSAGSEHSIDEKFYAMEMQMVFFDKRFHTD